MTKRWGIPMTHVKILTLVILFGTFLSADLPAYGGQTGTAENSDLVLVTFERSQDKVLRADAVIRAPSEIVWDLIRNVEHYPSLVPWIEESRAAAGSRDPEHQVYMALRLPWPVGRIWNVVQIEDVDHQTLRWSMVNGTIKENSGYVHVEPLGNATRLTYESRVDIGYPIWLVDPFERNMIRQFLTKLQMQACPVIARVTGKSAESSAC